MNRPRLSRRPDWSDPVWVVGAGVAAAAVILGGFVLLAPDRGTTENPFTARPTDEALPDIEPLTIEDVVDEIELPVPDLPLEVSDAGVTVVVDRFDDTKREGTYAALIRNPNGAWMASGVEVQATIVDQSGATVAEDRSFIEVVLPGQEVAVASLLFGIDEEAVELTDEVRPDLVVEVDMTVARWRETGPIAGGLFPSEVISQPAEFGGIRTSFSLRSTLDDPLRDVAVVAVYRDRDGRIIGGYDAFIDRITPDEPVEGRVELLTNIQIEDVARTDLYPIVGFGFIPTA